MIMELYSIKDEEMGFIPPVPLKNDAIARRWFKEYQVENITMRLFPSSFSLYHMGTWNSETGEIKAIQPQAVPTNKDDRKEIQDEISERL